MPCLTFFFFEYSSAAPLSSPPRPPPASYSPISFLTRAAPWQCSKTIRKPQSYHFLLADDVQGLVKWLVTLPRLLRSTVFPKKRDLMWGRRGSSLGPRFHLELLQLDQSAHLVDHLGLEAVVNLSFFNSFH